MPERLLFAYQTGRFQPKDHNLNNEDLILANPFTMCSECDRKLVHKYGAGNFTVLKCLRTAYSGEVAGRRQETFGLNIKRGNSHLGNLHD